MILASKESDRAENAFQGPGSTITGHLRLQIDTEYLQVDAGNEEDPSLIG